MKTLLTLIAVAGLALSSLAQTNTPAPANLDNPIEIAQSWFDLNDTNSLVNAKELSVIPIAKWDADENKAGGGAKLNWYVTDQQGLGMSYTEFSNYSTWQVGYSVRTVFGALEVAVETGTMQRDSDGFGEVVLYTSPSLTYQIKKTKKVDFRVSAGADIIPGSTNPWLGLVLRFSR